MIKEALFFFSYMGNLITVQQHGRTADADLNPLWSCSRDTITTNVVFLLHEGRPVTKTCMTRLCYITSTDARDKWAFAGKHPTLIHIRADQYQQQFLHHIVMLLQTTQQPQNGKMERLSNTNMCEMVCKTVLFKGN